MTIVELALRCAIIFAGLITLVKCGCSERNLCCSGQNLSCVSTEKENFLTNNVASHQQLRIKRQKRQESSTFERESKNSKFSSKVEKTEEGFHPVSFEPEFDEEQTNQDEEGLEVAHFGLFDEPELEDDLTTDNVIYNGGHKEIRYRIFKDSPSKEKTGELNHYGSLSTRNDGTKKCYCDESCRKASDCCSDYDTFCSVMDCQVTSWSGWSHCETTNLKRYGFVNKCGPGVSKRYRSIVNENKNGGAVCPHVLEHRACFKVDDSCSGLDDVALLLPYNFGAARVPGYRNKTYYDLPKDIFKLKQLKTSCLVFRVVWFNNCTDETVRSVFVPNAHICVECQPTAYLPHRNGLCKGEGAVSTISHWSLINVKNKKCYGQWIHIEKQNNCKCDKSYSSVYRFVFV